MKAPRVTIHLVYISNFITEFLSEMCFVSDETKHKLCTTPTCIKIAANMLDSIDFSTDPCDDFFSFTCGKWLKENIIPDDRVEYSINTLIEQTVEKEMKSITKRVVNFS